MGAHAKGLLRLHKHSHSIFTSSALSDFLLYVDIYIVRAFLALRKPAHSLSRMLSPSRPLYVCIYIRRACKRVSFLTLRKPAATLCPSDKYTSAYDSIRQHTSAYASIRQHTYAEACCDALRHRRVVSACLRSYETHALKAAVRDLQR